MKVQKRNKTGIKVKIQTFITAAFMLFACLFASAQTAMAAPNPGIMEVDFIDVGQGDATLIQCGGHNILIDAGDNSKGTTVQSFLQYQGITNIDLFVITHFDSDHCGGADVIISKFPVDTLMVSDYYVDSASCRDVFSAAAAKGLNYRTPAAGETIMVGDMMVTFVAPAYYGYDGPNNSSVGLIVQYGATSFFFGGDAEEAAENAMLSSGLNLNVNVYQVNHHGSRTSSTLSFLSALSPQYAVISCAAGNSYGHPHAEPLNNLRMMGVSVYRTDEQGTVTAYSDGLTVTFDSAPSVTWQTGVQLVSDWGDSEPADWEQELQAGIMPAAGEVYYVGNANSMKFHYSYCDSVQKMAEHNKVNLSGYSRDQIISMGYVPCQVCNP